MDGACRADAWRGAEAVPRAATRDPKRVAAHADTDLAQPRTRRVGEPDCHAHYPAEGRLRTYRPWPIIAEADLRPRDVGDRERRHHPCGASTLRFGPGRG